MTIQASDFHSLYRNCFLKYPDYTEINLKLQEEFPNLLLIDDSANRDKRIIQVISKMRAALANNFKGQGDNPTLDHFKLCTSSIPNSAAFWLMFSKKVPFENPTADKVRILFVSRIKQLQDELQRLGIKDNESLKDFFEDAEFFENQRRLTLPAQAPSPQKGYYKPGGDCSMNVGFLRKFNEPSTLSNMYSEEELERSMPEFADQIRNIRDGFAARAVNGELIKEIIVVHSDKNSNFSEISLSPYDAKAYPHYPYIVTLCALVYNEIKNDRIHSMNEAVSFAMAQLKHNSILIPNEEENIDPINLMIECAGAVKSQFAEAIAKIEKDQGSKEQQGEKN